MAYDNRRRDFSREHIYIVEIDGKYCANTFSVSPCTATAPTGQECYNTLVTCQDLPNYIEEGLTYRFCEPVSPHPIGLNGVLPIVSSVSMTPAEINPGGGLGVRSSLSITFDDPPYHDIGIDKYVDTRDYIATDQGSYWTKWRARNPYYQGQIVRVISAYLENNEYKAENGQIRYYILESVDVSNGRCTIRAKDPLKALADDRIKIPAASTGVLAADITNSQTSFDVSPVGAGAQYSGFTYVRVDSEVMEVTDVTGDTLTVVRGQYNTQAEEHDADATVQVCKWYNGIPLDEILVDIVQTAFPPTPPATYHPFVDINQWQSEVDNFLPGNYTALITEPTGASKLLSELGESIPHSLYWDERFSKIYIKAIRGPDSTGTTVTEDGDIIGDLRVKDMQDMRKSTIYVYFGQIDPTEKLDETRNYRQLYVREDTDSVDRYGSRRVKEIFSRWILNINKAAAIRSATRWGRRFADAPRQFEFPLAPKDSGLWAGDPCFISHRQVVAPSGAIDPAAAQITSVREVGDTFRYVALEHLYGQQLPDDEEPGVNDVVLSGELFNIDLLSIYEATVGTPDGTTQARFIVESNATIGSQAFDNPSVATGTWPSGATVTLINNGVIAGAGGKGGEGSVSDHTDGGDAISLDYAISLDNQGLIGGGGGGGASNSAVLQPGNVLVIPAGGGGAGALPGEGGNTYASQSNVVRVNGEDGTLEFGGDGGSATYNGTTIQAYDGGDLGQDAPAVGGAAGYAIRQNGNTVTYINTGDIRGTTA